MAVAEKKRKPKARRRKGAPIRPSAPENAWDRQPTESAPAYAAFREYLLAGGERSLRSVAQKVGKSKNLISRWSTQNRWVARVDAFEAEAAKRADEAALDVLEERARRQAELAVVALEAMAAPSVELVRRINEDREILKSVDLDELTRLAATTARALPRVVHVERLARGQSTTNLGGPRGGPIETDSPHRADAEKRAQDMSDEALDAFLLGAETQRKATAKAAAKKRSKK